MLPSATVWRKTIMIHFQAFVPCTATWTRSLSIKYKMKVNPLSENNEVSSRSVCAWRSKTYHDGYAHATMSSVMRVNRRTQHSTKNRIM
ncbi:hypothetical protein EDC04DRAFT_2713068, partial [Pisolithus marmoratus]